MRIAKGFLAKDLSRAVVVQRPFSCASLAQSADALASNARCSPFESEAMHHIYVPVAQTVDTASLNLALMHVQIVPGTPHITRLAQLVEATVLEAVQSEFESPGGYQFFYVSVAQWIRVLAYEARGCRFESCRARHVYSLVAKR
jgi:hypothetical protein